REKSRRSPSSRKKNLLLSSLLIIIAHRHIAQEKSPSLISIDYHHSSPSSSFKKKEEEEEGRRSLLLRPPADKPCHCEHPVYPLPPWTCSREVPAIAPAAHVNQQDDPQAPPLATRRCPQPTGDHHPLLLDLRIPAQHLHEARGPVTHCRESSRGTSWCYQGAPNRVHCEPRSRSPSSGPRHSAQRAFPYTPRHHPRLGKTPLRPRQQPSPSRNGRTHQQTDLSEPDLGAWATLSSTEHLLLQAS
ncbi:Unknown protein, partial [Striga hermonthica]